MIYVISITVFSSVIFILVGLLLLVEAKVVKKDDCVIVVNDDEEKALKIPGGTTLLSALSENKIYLPSACGGGGLDRPGRSPARADRRTPGRGATQDTRATARRDLTRASDEAASSHRRDVR